MLGMPTPTEGAASKAGDCPRSQGEQPENARQKNPGFSDLSTSRISLRLNPYGQSIGPANAPSRCLPMIVAQEPAQSLAALHRLCLLKTPKRRESVASLVP